MFQNSKLCVYAIMLVVIILAQKSSGSKIKTTRNKQAFSIGSIKLENIITLTRSEMVDVAKELKHSPTKETVEQIRKRRQSDGDVFDRFIRCLLEYAEGLTEYTHCNITEPEAADYATTDEWLEARNRFHEQACRPECIALNNEFLGCLEIEFTKEEQDYLDSVRDHYSCGRITSDGDFCPVHLARVYGAPDDENEEIERVWYSCEYEPLSSNRSDPNCQATDCTQFSSEFIDVMGCCSTPVLGNISRCIDTPEACSYVYGSSMGVKGSATLVTLVMIVMVFVNAATLLG